MLKKSRYIITIMLLISIFLIGCSQKNEVHFDGEEYLIFNGEKYVLTSGIYNESDIRLGKTDSFTIYEVEGDKEHNYLVARSSLDNTLYVKESFSPDNNEIEGVYLMSANNCHYDKKIVELIQKIITSEKMKLDNQQEIDKIQQTGLEVGVKYKNNPVGKNFGIIKKIKDDYVIYLFNNEWVLLNASDIDVLREYDDDIIDIIERN
jgi:hypothetical protein